MFFYIKCCSSSTATYSIFVLLVSSVIEFDASDPGVCVDFDDYVHLLPLFQHFGVLHLLKVTHISHQVKFSRDNHKGFK